jgi:Fe-S-cluster-containing hydrogenase component 2/CRP-like cAMP-binding protein
MSMELFEGAFLRDDDEGLFSRDLDGQLVRLDAPTQSDFAKKVTLQIDGKEVTVPLAEPLKDANGNIVQDKDGRPIPRYTTILDAALTLYVKEVGDEVNVPIPTLCHLPHMKPVAVCRLCVVQIYGQKRGKRAAERKLLPACQHQVKDGMEVFTMKAEGPDGDRVRQTVKVMTELLAAANLKPTEPAELDEELAPFNELGQAVAKFDAKPERFKRDAFSLPAPVAPLRVGRGKRDLSSPVFQVDHDACVLCERCIRACDDVQENHVIGRTGKGPNAGIGFDLNDPMGNSSCVQCGECMVSCPTNAILFKPGSRISIKLEDRSREILSTTELLSDPMFAGVSPKFLLWQQGLVVRRTVHAGEVLCRQGDAGNTAFLIKEGEYDVSIQPTVKPQGKGTQTLFAPKGGSKKPVHFTVDPDAVIIGEMSCLSATPRTATIKAKTKGEVWELRRNVLDRLMRVPFLRDRFEDSYKKRALDQVLGGSDLFSNVPENVYDAAIEFLRPRLRFVRVRAGERIFVQDERATDGMYIVRLGHVRIGVRRFGSQDSNIISRGPGAVIGEIGLLGLGRGDLRKSPKEIEARIAQALDAASTSGALDQSIPAGLRSATVSALNHVELAKIERRDFLEMIRTFPPIREQLVNLSLKRLSGDVETDPLMADYVQQGLYEGQSILVLDMDHCTRCDECTKGCIHRHGDHTHGTPIPRLLRDGMRFDRFLVATSCRSCTDAHCMVGCPVDSIHRGRHQQIVIEDHCIGCGLCAANCPYGSIFMVPNERNRIEVPDPDREGRFVKVAQMKAAACDLCDAEGEQSRATPQCVASCPHEAAHRMTGAELLRQVIGLNN